MLAKFEVVFVSHSASRTGAPLILLNLMRWLRANTDLRFGIVLLEGGPLVPEFRAVAPTWLSRPDVPDSWSTGWRRRVARVASLGIAGRIHLRFALVPPALYYFNTVVTGYVAHRFAGSGTPALAHVHEMKWAIKVLSPPSGPGLVERLKPYTRRFIAVARVVERNLIDDHGVPAEKVALVNEFFIPPEAPAGDRAEARRAFLEANQIPEDALIVGSVGSFEARKGSDLFVEAALRADRTRSGRPIHYVWMGHVSDREHAERAKAGAGRGRLHLLGPSPRPAETMAHFDLFALTSREDPYPLVMLEAASLGKPILYFRGSGGADEFVEEDAGSSVPMEDAPALAGRIVDLLDDDDLRARLGATAHAKALDHTLEATAPKLWALIRRELPGRGA